VVTTTTLRWIGPKPSGRIRCHRVNGEGNCRRQCCNNNNNKLSSRRVESIH